jgi:hypothetical protein
LTLPSGGDTGYYIKIFLPMHLEEEGYDGDLEIDGLAD